MIEKRFKSVIDEETMSIMPYLVSDKEEECFYNLEGCVDLLNKQQNTITHLEKVNGKNFAKRRLLEKDNLILRKENEQLRQENVKFQKQIKAYPINEQYAEEIIEQNQKLRIERNDLRKENEQLKKQLDKGCKSLSENEIRQAYAELNRKEREKHSSGNTIFTATLPNNEVVY